MTQDNYAGPLHSQLSFPALIATTMNMSYKNLGIDGASNQQILQSVRASNITADDIAIICWSHWSRNYAFRADGEKQILVHFKDCEPFYAIYDETALQYASLLTIEHANLWLSHRSIPLLNFSTHKHDGVQSNGYMLDFMDIHAVDLACDMIHFGEQSHSIWAAIVTEHVTTHILSNRSKCANYLTENSLLSDNIISSDSTEV